MRILIITYYWPPSGGAGVQRWLKTVKYLRSFGCEPIVYTADGGEVPALDFSLEKDVPPNITVIKRKIWEPYLWYKKFIGQKKDQKINAGFLSESETPKLTQKIAVWIRGNFFVPDARCFWIKPSVKFLIKYLKENPVDVIVSTGPPHSMHMIALGLKKKTGLPWLADFRDPWTKIDFYDKLMLTKLADLKHKSMEKKVLKNADAVTTVSWSWANDFKTILDREINVVTNGFDEDDFKVEPLPIYEGFLIHHIGAMNSDRNPHMFWKALADLCKELPGFSEKLKIKLTGKNDVSVIKSIKENGLEAYLEIVNYLPHSEVVKTLMQSPVLLLPLNDTPNVKGIIPGKLFEYLAAKRPIIAIGDITGDTAKIIKETNAGYIAGFADYDGIKTSLVNLYHDYQNKQLHLMQTNLIDKYTRKNLTKQLVEVLKTIVKK